MQSMHIVHIGALNEYAGGYRPEAFTVHHNGDFSGDVKIEVMAPRVTVLPAASGTIYGNPITEVVIPFEVLKQAVAEYARRYRISALKDATDDDVLLGGAS